MTDGDLEAAPSFAVTAGAPSWRELCDVVWTASAASRRAIHLAVSRRGCPTRQAPYGSVDPAGRSTSQDCGDTGCLDFFHDLVLAGHERLRDRRAAEVGNAGAYAHTVITRLIADRKRDQRVRLGLPAKPGRADGPAARVVAELRLRSPESAEWLIVLFRMMLAYSARTDRLSAAWPLDGWAMEKSRFDGVVRVLGDPARRELRVDTGAVITMAAEVLGEAWATRHLRVARHVALAPVPLDEGCASVVVDFDRIVMSRQLRTFYLQARLAGDSVSAAYRTAVEATTRMTAPPLTAVTRSILSDLDAELAQAS